jgi:hypothetical protein
MAIFRVTLPAGSRTLEFDRVKEHIVEAEFAADALIAVKAVSTQDLDAIWDSATITEISPDFEDFVFTVTVDALGTPAVVTYTAVPGDTWTSIGARLAQDLIDDESFASTWTINSPHAKYGVLVVAAGTGVDDLGDKTLDVSAVAPNGLDLSSAFFSRIIEEGAANADLSVDIMHDCPTPRVLGSYK